MELFIDTAEIDEIKSLNVTGLIDGVTTNPSLIANLDEISLKPLKKFVMRCQDP